MYTWDLLWSSRQSREVGTIMNPKWQMKKLRLRGVRQIAQDHKDDKWQVETKFIFIPKPILIQLYSHDVKLSKGMKITFSLQTAKHWTFGILNSETLFPTWGNCFLALRLGSIDTWWMRQLLENTEVWGASIFSSQSQSLHTLCFI